MQLFLQALLMNQRGRAENVWEPRAFVSIINKIITVGFNLNLNNRCSILLFSVNIRKILKLQEEQNVIVRQSYIKYVKHVNKNKTLSQVSDLIIWENKNALQVQYTLLFLAGVAHSVQLSRSLMFWGLFYTIMMKTFMGAANLKPHMSNFACVVCLKKARQVPFKQLHHSECKHV